MIEIIKSKHDLCTGCNRCVRECPMEMANITYLDEDGLIKVDIDTKKCIFCGRCILACKHDSRYYIDDTARFFDDLHRGVKISVIAAPSIKTNLIEYKKLFTYLRRLGVKSIYDVSLGADICIWAHTKYLSGAKKSIIAQPCPVIVNFCQLYHHDLLDKLSPIHSPMACTAVYMKKYRGIEGKIAALTPCMAKTLEFEATGLADYNITYKSLTEYLASNDIELPDEETSYDHEESGLGSLFPVPGGLKENLEYFLGKSLHITRAEGFSVFEKLDEYSRTPEAFLPDIFDVLNCVEGCNSGTANSHGRSLFEIDKTMNNIRGKAAGEQKREHYKAVYEEYDKIFDLPDFLRTYRPISLIYPNITDKDINRAFTRLGKTVYDAQHIDCGACGSNTCFDMARKIALKVNTPENCIVKSKEDAKTEHESYIKAQEQILRMEKIREADERMLDIINVNPQINILFDSSLKVIDCNPAACEFLGFASKEELLSGLYKRLADSLPEFQPDGRRSSPKERLTVAAREGFARFETLFIINGKKSTLDIILKRIPFQDSFAIIAYMHDMTDINNLRMAAENASNAKSAFLSTMSHEIRTPLNAIAGMAAIAEASDDITKKDYAINKMKNASAHLLGVINDILDMSKIEADKFELSHVSFNFRKMLNNIIDFIDFSMTERKQKFFVSVDDKIPQTVVGDDQRLSQVITNLLTNSVKFTPENGTIRLSVELKSEYEGIYCLLITIEDTGVGISDEHKGRLFDLYEQAKSDTSRTYGGSGLGLSISKRLVELMGGEIHVESEVNKGSKFIFTIALTRDSGEKDRLSPDIGDVLKEFADVGLSARQGEDELYIDDFSGYTALLVEDIAINREIVVTLLEPTKISIECVENGKQALDVIEEDPTRYDIIFMDIQMPEMDGYEATLKIRALEDEHASIIPIVAMTANVFREDIEKCIEVGMNAHLGKPLILEDVISQMRLFLQGKQHVTKIERRKEERRKLADRRQLTNIWLSQDILQLPDIANITEDAWEGED